MSTIDADTLWFLFCRAMKAPKDKRNRCAFCKAVTWNKDLGSFMRDHDRPQGGVCQQAAAQYAASKPPEWKPNWKPL